MSLCVSVSVSVRMCMCLCLCVAPDAPRGMRRHSPGEVRLLDYRTRIETPNLVLPDPKYKNPRAIYYNAVWTRHAVLSFNFGL
eukprot:2893071-Rhodomonas_salina.1